MGSQLGALFGGLFGDAGQNFVGLQGGADQVFGTKPKVAPFVPVDTSTETATALGANTENFDAITAFLNQIVPGFSDILATGLGNASSELSGQIPNDVKDEVMRSSAFQSLQGGYGGTAMAHALTARDLGLTSLNLTNMGQQNALGLIGASEQAYSPWTVSTSQQAAITAADNAGTQATQQFANNVKAAPNPGAAGTFNVDAALGQQMLSLGGAFLGGAIGGGGGGGGGGGATAAVGGQTPFGNYNYNPSTGGYDPYAAPGAWSSNFSQAVGASDARLKERIRFVRLSPMGYKIYQFVYRGCKTIYEGVIAQQVLRVNPDAVYRWADGFMGVNYSMTDVKLRRA